MTGEKGRAAVLTELSLLAAAVFWGSNYAATKYAAGHIPQLPIVAFRFAIGGLLLVVVLRLLEPESRLERKDLLPMVGLGCLAVTVAQTSFTYGVSLTSTANTGLVFATAPVWGLLLGSVLGLERPTRWGVLGVGLSIVGVGVVFREGPAGAEGASPVGDVLILVAAITVGRTPCSRCACWDGTRLWQWPPTRSCSVAPSSCCSPSRTSRGWGGRTSV
jgi:drug/metabolite transporter (DMT)-like permease